MSGERSNSSYHGEGANGGCFFEIRHVSDGVADLTVGWSCVIVHRGLVPVTWLAELVAIATQKPRTLASFLEEHSSELGGSYALACDPAEVSNG